MRELRAAGLIGTADEPRVTPEEEHFLEQYEVYQSLQQSSKEILDATARMLARMKNLDDAMRETRILRTCLRDPRRGRSEGLDLRDRRGRIDHAEVADCRDPGRHAVARDHLLRWHRERDGAQVHPHHVIGPRREQHQPGPLKGSSRPRRKTTARSYSRSTRTLRSAAATSRMAATAMTITRNFLPGAAKPSGSVLGPRL